MALTRFNWTLGLLVVLTIVAGTASADPITLIPTKDATIWNVNPDTNYDADPVDNATDRLTLKRGTASEEDMHGYMAFDISAITGDVLSATLEYHESWRQVLQSVSIYGLNDGPGDLWSETGITWNNAPGNNTANNGDVLPGETTPILLAQLQFDASGAAHQVSNQALIDFLNADTNGIVTFIFVRADGSGGTHQIGGRLDNPDPADWRPTLEITFVPEPASLVLAGMGSLIMLRRRR